MIMVVLLILNIDHPVFRMLTQIFVWIAMILTLVSLTDYLMKNKDVLKD